MSWSVVSTCYESYETTLSFLAYYLDQGAEKIYLYLDNPSDRVAGLSHPQVDITVCDDAYWRDVHCKDARPIHQEIVQSKNANHAYKKCKSDWLLHTDADEFLFALDGQIEDAIATFSKDIYWVRTFEPLNSNSDGLLCFRPHKGAQLAQYVSPRYRNSLILGHDIGKSFVRCGMDDVTVRVHSAKLPNRANRMGHCLDLGILHCLNFGARAWADKYASRVRRNRVHKFGLKEDQIHRGNQSIAFYFEIIDTYEAGGVDALIELFQGAKNLTDEQIFYISQNAELHEFQFNFALAAQRHFGLNLGEMSAKTIIDWG